MAAVLHAIHCSRFVCAFFVLKTRVNVNLNEILRSSKKDRSKKMIF